MKAKAQDVNLNHKKLLTPMQVEQVFGLNSKSLANFRSIGKGPPYVKVGRLVFYRPEEIEKYLNDNTVYPNN